VRRLALAALLAATSCASPGPSLPAPEGLAETDPRVLACRTEATATPARREIARRAGPSVDQQEAARRETDRAIIAAYQACLQQAGLARPGGVEPVQRPVIAAERPVPGAPLPAEPGSVVPLAPPPGSTGY
jgi:hypothetical protein